MINPHTKSEVSEFTNYKDMKCNALGVVWGWLGFRSYVIYLKFT